MPFSVHESQRGETATALAILILADEKAPVSEENIQKLFKAAGVADVEAFWPTLMGSCLSVYNESR